MQETEGISSICPREQNSGAFSVTDRQHIVSRLKIAETVQLYLNVPIGIEVQKGISVAFAGAVKRTCNTVP